MSKDDSSDDSYDEVGDDDDDNGFFEEEEEEKEENEENDVDNENFEEDHQVKVKKDKVKKKTKDLNKNMSEGEHEEEEQEEQEDDLFTKNNNQTQDLGMVSEKVLTPRDFNFDLEVEKVVSVQQEEEEDGGSHTSSILEIAQESLSTTPSSTELSSLTQLIQQRSLSPQKRSSSRIYSRSVSLTRIREKGSQISQGHSRTELLVKISSPSLPLKLETDDYIKEDVLTRLALPLPQLKKMLSQTPSTNPTSDSRQNNQGQEMSSEALAGEKQTESMKKLDLDSTPSSSRINRLHQPSPPSPPLSPTRASTSVPQRPTLISSSHFRNYSSTEAPLPTNVPSRSATLSQSVILDPEAKPERKKGSAIEKFKKKGSRTKKTVAEEKEPAPGASPTPVDEKKKLFGQKKSTSYFVSNNVRKGADSTTTPPGAQVAAAAGTMRPMRNGATGGSVLHLPQFSPLQSSSSVASLSSSLQTVTPSQPSMGLAPAPVKSDPHLRQTLRAHKAPIFCLSVNTSYALSAGDDCSVLVWQLFSTSATAAGISNSPTHNYQNNVARLRFVMQGHRANVLCLQSWFDYSPLEPSSTPPPSTAPSTSSSSVVIGSPDPSLSSKLPESPSSSDPSLNYVSPSPSPTPSSSSLLTAAGLPGSPPVSAIPLPTTPPPKKKKTLAVSGSNDNDLRVWDVESGQCKHVLKGHTQAVMSVQVVPYNVTGELIKHIVVSGSYDNTLRAWDVASGTCLMTFTGHSAEVEALVVPRNLPRMISSGDDGIIRVWEFPFADEPSEALLNAESIMEKQQHQLSLHSASLPCADGHSSHQPQTLSQSQHQDQVQRRVQEQEQEQEQDQAQTKGQDQNQGPEGGHGRGQAGGLESSSPSASPSRPLLQKSRSSARFLAMTSRALSSSQKAQNLSSSPLALSQSNSFDSSRSMRMSMVDFKDLLTGVRGATSQEYPSQGRCLRTLIGHIGPIWCLQLVETSTDSNILLSGGDDFTIRVWDWQIGRCLRILKGHLDSVMSLALVSLAEGFDDRERITKPSEQFKSDQSTGSDNSTPENSSAETAQTKPDSALLIKSNLDKNGRDQYLVSSSDDGTLRVWDFYGGRCLRTLAGHSSEVETVSVRGRFVVSGGFDQTIRVWELPSGRCRHVLRGHTGHVSNVGFIDDMIVSTGDDALVCVWDSSCIS
eukprot:TRINITY_DN2580_c3_g1_i1.p1 TRINITY_DN2580_c3_g1~~TRINITY_DN2580_c3_g1_i1.p1  ORF type:complete len:1173 (-),score=335.94 TRINITY_DN2580_c3_g1_i1:61-3579(-)